MTLTDVQLEFPPEHVPPVVLGVRGPKSLQLAGRVADGVILAEGASPAYVRWAREQFEQGRAAANRSDPYRVTVYTMCTVDDDADAARDRMRVIAAPWLVAPETRYYWEALGISEEIAAIVAAGGDDPVGHMTRAMPDAWLHELAVGGAPQQGIDTIQRLADAGADSMVLVPLPTGDFAAQLDTFARTILPAFR